MNRQEKRILHGLYFDREIVGERTHVTSGEILWLAEHSLAAGRNWRGADGRFKTANAVHDNYLARMAMTTAQAERPLTHLRSTGYVDYNKGAHFFNIEVTGAGANRARKLHTMFGRLDLSYRDNKDGILWFFVVVVLSIVTSWITSRLTRDMPTRVAAPSTAGSTVTPQPTQRPTVAETSAPAPQTSTANPAKPSSQGP